MMAYFPAKSKELHVTSAPLIIMFKNTIFDIGEHQGICSVGTHMLNIHAMQSIMRARVSMPRLDIKQVVILNAKAILSSLAETRDRIRTSKTGILRKVWQSTSTKVNPFLKIFVFSRPEWFLIVTAIPKMVNSMRRFKPRMAQLTQSNSSLFYLIKLFSWQSTCLKNDNFIPPCLQELLSSYIEEV